MDQSTSRPTAWVIIPARGGSKGVVRKNLRPVGGEPLIARAVRQSLAAASVGRVVVSTDDPQIADAARTAGAEIVVRPAHLAGDEATSESALLHAIGDLAPDGGAPPVTLFVQATSPFIDPVDLERAVALVTDGQADVAFSVVRADVHLWRDGDTGPVGVNHDAAARLRRQDREAEYAETGAFYALDTGGFLANGHRFFGRIQMVEVAQADAVEIDTEQDLRLVEALIAFRPDTSRTSPIPALAVVTDFDGVHTNDRVTVDQNGTESVEVSRADGMGVSLLRRAGIPVLVLSTETNPVVQARADKLQVERITGCEDKLAALTAWAADHGIGLADVAYLGNDVNDVECLRAVGWPVVPADAHPAARAVAPFVLDRPGGGGAVRELADRVLAPVDTRIPVSPTERNRHG